LNHQIRERFAEADRIVTELRTADSSAAPTFLWSVLAALRSGQSHSRRNYVHNAKEYELEWELAPDPRAGAAMAANCLTLHPARVTRFTGHTSSPSTRQVSTFRMWLDYQSYLPLRIEFQPRSYLRIILEYEPPGGQPKNKPKEET
jgi:hypothetical protein